MSVENILPPSAPLEVAATLAPPAADPVLTQEYNAAPPSTAAIPAIAGYTLQEEIGRGGMGVVYRGEQISLRRPVALKMILAGNFATADAKRRFLAEAEIIARLQHPGIVQVYEFGTHAEHTFFSLEYVPGGSLDKQLAAQPLTSRDAAALVAKLARAMHYAHERGIVHRDLKPANVLLQFSREAKPSAAATTALDFVSGLNEADPKITDFGLAKHGESQLTASGAIMGTPSYMAPEQAEGKKAVTPAADIYALGAILYECLTGRPPFKAATPLDTVVQVLSQEPVPPRSLVPQTPRDLETICLKCLRKEPAKRYATAADLAEELDRFLAGEPIQARPVGRSEKLLRWCRRNPYLAGAVGAAALLAVGLLGLLAFFVQHRLQAATDLEKENQATLAALNQAEQRKQQAQAAEKEALTAKDRADDQLYANHIALAHREWQANNHLWAAELLRRTPQERRGWEWHFLHGLMHQHQCQLFPHALVRCVRFSPDGTQIVGVLRDGMLLLWDAATGDEVRRQALTATDAVFRPGGKELAVVSGNKVLILDAATWKELRRIVLKNSMPGLLSYTTDGQRLLTLAQDGSVSFWDASSGAVQTTVPATLPLGDKSPMLGILRGCLSPDGRYWAMVDAKDRVQVFELNTGQEIFTGTSHAYMVGSLAFSPDCRFLASPGGDGSIRVLDLAARKVVRQIKGHASWVECAVFSPDGTKLASGSKDMTVRVWDVASGEELHCFRGHAADIHALAFSADGQRLVTTGLDAGIKVWSLKPRVFVARHILADEKQGLTPIPRQTSQEALTLLPHVGPPIQAVFSPDSRYLASVTPTEYDQGRTELIRLWDLTTGQEMRSLPAIPGRLHQLCFSPDGKQLAMGSGKRLGVGSRPFGDEASEVKLLDLATGQTTFSWKGRTAIAVLVAISPDGRWLAAALSDVKNLQAAAAGQNDGSMAELRLWSLPEGKEVLAQEFPKTYLRGLGFTADDKLVLGEVNGTVSVWSCATRTRERTVHVEGGPIIAMALSPRGILATTHLSDRDVRLTDFTTGKLLRTLSGHPWQVLHVAWNPDGSRLLSAGNDYMLKVWEPQTGWDLLTFREFRQLTSSIAWSPDGTRIVVTCADGPVKIWEAKLPSRLDTSSWPILYADRFDGPDGKVPEAKDATWHRAQGRLRGRLANTKDPKTGVPFVGAFYDVPCPVLPTTVDVRFDMEVSQPMLIGAGLSGKSGLSVWPYVTGSVTFFGPVGAGMFQYRDGHTARVCLPTACKLEPGRVYRWRILRQPRRLTLWIDGQEILAEDIPFLEGGKLHLQGSWGKAGDTLWFDNLEIRAPKTE